ncbi:MAG: hypothetical protein HKN48_11005 [Flavobacteriaceae bacterium]|nr:hypothetical protein [Flavobacteriaceae bacterium]
MKSIFALIFTLIIFSACSSSKLVNDWKSPETTDFYSNKVLVIGMADDLSLRKQFETELTSQLEKNEVSAVRSIDFFETSFIDEKKTEAELNKIEKQLLDAGFDAILFSKVTGVEDKITAVQEIRDFNDTFNSFKEDYYVSQGAFNSKMSYQSYKLYHAETNLYCICPEKERELIWSGNIDIVENDNRNKSVRDYVKTLLETLEDKQLLILDI